VSERHRSVLVGAFAVGAILIVIAGALFISGSGLGVERIRVVMAFDGSLRGLNVGAPVALRGVTIGQITGIQLRLEPEAGDLTMLVEADLEPDNVQLPQPLDEELARELVKRGLRAQLGMQSLLTGLLYVQLDFHPDSESRLASIDSPYPQIPTIPTELEQFRASLESIDFVSITESFDRVASGLDELLSSGELQALPGTLQETLAAIRKASDGLGSAVDQGAPRVATLLDDGSRIMGQLETRLPQILDSLENSLAQL